MPGDAPLLEVGRIGRAHGVKGAVHVTLGTDRTERLAPGARVHDGRQWLTVVSSRPQPRNVWVVQFDGIVGRDAAEALSGRVVSAAPIEDPDAIWVHDLIGSQVVEVGGTDRGQCTSVIQNPAHDLLELDSGALVPVTFIVSSVNGMVTIDPPDGLFDL